MYLTVPNEDTMEEDFLEQTQGRNIDLFVCSDGEAILGIGDQGVGVSRIRTPLSLWGGVTECCCVLTGYRCT